MGEVIQFRLPESAEDGKPDGGAERAEGREPPGLSDGSSVDAPAVVLAPWSLVLAGRVYSSLQLTFWVWKRNEMAMDFFFGPWAARYLRSPIVDRKLWSRLHAVYFSHYGRGLPSALRIPLVARRFISSELRGHDQVRIRFETAWWDGTESEGRTVTEQMSGNRSEENASEFECQFMLKT